ncbi:MAG: T9SS type A sorting domain-containing protein, partial [Bacteroidia bacterium]
SYNNLYHSEFEKEEELPDNFYLEFKTNNYYTHNAWTLYDDNDNIIATSSFTAANTLFKEQFNLTGCYKLVITDVGQDGLYWWANTAQGSGYIRFRDLNNNTLKTLQTDFGGFIVYSFSTYPTTSVAEKEFGGYVKVYPNPAMDKVYIEGNATENSEVKLLNALGQVLGSYKTDMQGNLMIDVSNQNPGIYFVEITRGTKMVVKKVVVQ